MNETPEPTEIADPVRSGDMIGEPHVVLHRGYADTLAGPLHYAVAGQGPDVLLLHQTPRSLDEFREVQPLLAQRGFRALAMDMLGFGMSPSLPAPQTIFEMAEAALELLDTLGIEQTALLGHHTGALVAIEMAASAPERVGAIVLSSPPFIATPAQHSETHHPQVDRAPVAADGSHLTELWRLRRPFYPEDRPDLLDRFIRDALAPGVDPTEGHRACRRYPMLERIVLVTAPVLILGAEDDPFSFPHVAQVRDHLTQAARVEVRTIPGGRIPLMEEFPEPVVEATAEFLNSRA